MITRTSVKLGALFLNLTRSLQSLIIRYMSFNDVINVIIYNFLSESHEDHFSFFINLNLNFHYS